MGALPAQLAPSLHLLTARNRCPFRLIPDGLDLGRCQRLVLNKQRSSVQMHRERLRRASENARVDEFYSLSFISRRTADRTISRSASFARCGKTERLRLRHITGLTECLTGGPWKISLSELETPVPRAMHSTYPTVPSQLQSCRHPPSLQEPWSREVRGLQGLGEVSIFVVLFFAGIIPSIIYYICI